MDYLFKKGSVSVRKMRDSICDYVFLAEWLSQSVDTDDNSGELENVLKNYNPKTMADRGVMPCIIEYDGIAVGYIQYYYINNDDCEVSEELLLKNYEKPIGINILISDVKYQNRGIGTETIKNMLDYLLKNEGADIVIIDSKADNEKAIHCYEKIGFSKVETILDDNADDVSTDKVILVAKAS